MSTALSASAETLALEEGPARFGTALSVSRAGFHRVAYVEWGDPAAARTVLCAHGLSRQGRDFDPLATALAANGWRVICPDLPGRGRSDWLRNKEDYTLPQYVTDMTVLLAHLGIAELDWIGTSLGGLIGMIMAGQPNSPVRRLVINDIGPFLPWQALHDLGAAVRMAPRGFADLDAAVTYYRKSLAPFGELSDAQWRHLARHSLAEQPDGSWQKRVDPEITAAFRPTWFFNLSLWTYWDKIACPTLVLRGTDSNLLLRSTAAEMAKRGPKARTLEFPGCGHAPALMDDDQIQPIVSWLATEPVRSGR